MWYLFSKLPEDDQRDVEQGPRATRGRWLQTERLSLWEYVGKRADEHRFELVKSVVMGEASPWGSVPKETAV